MAKNFFENPFGKHEGLRQTVRKVGAVAILGGMVTGIGSACSITARTADHNSHAITARTDLLQAVAASTGSELVDISGMNRNMAGWFVDQDHMMVGLGKPADIPASLKLLGQASTELSGLKFNEKVKQEVDTELTRDKVTPPVGPDIPAYNERVLHMATSVDTGAVNGNMISSDDYKIWGASAGVAAIGAGMIALSIRRPQE